jgi:pyridoxine 5-phosphate synthase
MQDILVDHSDGVMTLTINRVEKKNSFTTAMYSACADALDAARSIGAPVVELHTGSWCDAVAHGELDKANREFGRIRVAAARAHELGIECHAGHGLDYDTARKIAALPQVVELNIGHFLMGEAIFVGLPETLRRMRAAMDEGRGQAS